MLNPPQLNTTLNSQTQTLYLYSYPKTKKMDQHDYLREIESKASHDPHHDYFSFQKNQKLVYVPGPVIIGAGPSGLAVAACLREKGVPSLILERCNCIASLWQLKTYDRLSLHLPKQFCELPLMPFPETFPTYPTKQQFVEYLEGYARKFCIEPSFEERVVRAEFDEGIGFWRIRSEKGGEEREYVSRWVVAATGENAEEVVPEIEGMREKEEEGGLEVVHTCQYKSGAVFEGKTVLVVGCGNSGMEICLDLCNYGATPSLVVRDSVHVLPREMLGKSTFGLSMWLLKWFPISLVDRFLLAVSRFMLGDTTKLGIKRPQLGPLQLKNLSGKTPVLDIGTLAKIKSGDVKICPAIRRVKGHKVEFVDGRDDNFDVIILATGYKSNVPSWLKENDMFSKKDGLPQRPFPNGWKGARGLYAVGFTKRGLLGASMDAKKIAEDIQICWKIDVKHLQPLENYVLTQP